MYPEVMSTKAEQFKAQQQRDANPPRPKHPPKPRRDSVVDTALVGTSATDRKAGIGATEERNRSQRAKRKGGAKLEGSASGRPSRKSTRKSEGRVKRTNSLERKAVQKASVARLAAGRSR